MASFDYFLSLKRSFIKTHNLDCWTKYYIVLWHISLNNWEIVCFIKILSNETFLVYKFLLYEAINEKHTINSYVQYKEIIDINYLFRYLLSNKTLKKTLRLPELNPSIVVRIKAFLKWLFSKVFDIWNIFNDNAMQNKTKKEQV